MPLRRKYAAKNLTFVYSFTVRSCCQQKNGTAVHYKCQHVFGGFIRLPFRDVFYSHESPVSFATPPLGPVHTSEKGRRHNSALTAQTFSRTLSARFPTTHCRCCPYSANVFSSSSSISANQVLISVRSGAIRFSIFAIIALCLSVAGPICCIRSL